MIRKWNMRTLFYNSLLLHRFGALHCRGLVAVIVYTVISVFYGSKTLSSGSYKAFRCNDRGFTTTSSLRYNGNLIGCHIWCIKWCSMCSLIMLLSLKYAARTESSNYTMINRKVFLARDRLFSDVFMSLRWKVYEKSMFLVYHVPSWFISTFKEN